MGHILIRPLRAKAVWSMIAALASLAAAPWAHAGPSLNSPADMKAISDIEMYISLQIDMKNAMPYYGPDAVVYDMPAPGVYHGSKQIYDGFEPQLATLKSIKISFPDFNMVSDGTMACVAMQVQNHVVFKGGAAASYLYRELDVFHKIDGKWKITQQHLSFPTVLKTGMTVMNGPIQLIGRLDWGADTLPARAMDATEAKTEILQWMVEGANTADVDHWGQLYGKPDDNTVLYDAAYPGDLRGLRRIQDYYRPIFRNFASVKSDIRESSVDTDGVLGAVIDRQAVRMDFKNGGKTFSTFRQSDCLHRVNGKWYALFEMLSFPADLKTGKSIMGGLPAPRQ